MRGVGLSFDGNFILSGGSDGSITVHRFKSQALEDNAKAVLEERTKRLKVVHTSFPTHQQPHSHTNMDTVIIISISPDCACMWLTTCPPHPQALENGIPFQPTPQPTISLSDLIVEAGPAGIE